MPLDDDSEEFDVRGDTDEGEGLSQEVTDIVEHLRETLPHDMARRIIPNRLGVTPSNDKELEDLMEVLVAEAFYDGYDSWDNFPY